MPGDSESIVGDMEKEQHERVSRKNETLRDFSILHQILWYRKLGMEEIR